MTAVRTLVVLFGFVVLGTPALAATCNDHYRACMRNESALGRDAGKRCTPNFRRCEAQCKSRKSAFFVGPSTGRQFAADCR